MLRPLLKAGTLLAVFALLLILPTSVAAEGNPPFAFSDETPLVVDWEKGSSFTVLNYTDEELSLDVSISELGFKDAQTEMLVGNDSVLGFLEEIKVPAERFLSVDIDIINNKIKAGTYTGFITLAGTVGEEFHVAHREISITVPSSKATFEPGSATWSMRAIRWFPINTEPQCRHQCEIPLIVDGEEDPDLGSALLGVLSGDNGGSASVFWGGWEKDDEFQPLVLSYDPPYMPGTYSGDIDILPKDEDKGNISLTLNVTDFFLWPILVLMLGTILGVLTKQFVERRWFMFEFLERATKIKEDFQKGQNSANETFRITLDCQNTEGPCGYSLSESLNEEVNNLKETILAIGRGFFKPSDEAEDSFTNIRTMLETLEALPESWKAFAEELKKLKTARNKFQMPWPRIVDHADVLLLKSGKKALEYKDLEAKREEVRSCTRWLKKWPDLEKRVKKAMTMAEAIKDCGQVPPGKADETLDVALRKLQEIMSELLEPGTPEDFEARNVETDLIDAEAMVWGLAYYLPKDSIDQLVTGDRSMAKDLFESRKDLAGMRRGQEPPSAVQPTRRGLEWLTLLSSELLDQMQASSEWLFGGLGFFMALVTGLSALYLGQNFGTWKDYATALTWGFGTQVALETFISVLGLVRIRK